MGSKTQTGGTESGGRGGSELVRVDPSLIEEAPEAKEWQEMPEYMIDVETLSANPGAACFAIGIVEFRRSGWLGESLEVQIDLADALDGADVSDRTLSWWVDDRPSLLRELQTDAGTQREAVDQVTDFLPDENDFFVWANGAEFDFGMVLRPLFDRVGESLPWRFYNQRCMRTLEVWIPSGTNHHPLDDARRQAIEVMRYHHHFGIGAHRG